MTRLLGGPEMFLDTWSGLVNLTCVVETLEPPKVVEWFHNKTQVKYLHIIIRVIHSHKRRIIVGHKLYRIYLMVCIATI